MYNNYEGGIGGVNYPYNPEMTGDQSQIPFFHPSEDTMQVDQMYPYDYEPNINTDNSVVPVAGMNDNMYYNLAPNDMYEPNNYMEGNNLFQPPQLRQQRNTQHTDWSNAPFTSAPAEEFYYMQQQQQQQQRSQTWRATPPTQVEPVSAKLTSSPNNNANSNVKKSGLNPAARPFTLHDSNEVDDVNKNKEVSTSQSDNASKPTDVDNDKLIRDSHALSSETKIFRSTSSHQHHTPSTQLQSASVSQFSDTDFASANNPQRLNYFANNSNNNNTNTGVDNLNNNNNKGYMYNNNNNNNIPLNSGFGRGPVSGMQFDMTQTRLPPEFATQTNMSHVPATLNPYPMAPPQNLSNMSRINIPSPPHHSPNVLYPTMPSNYTQGQANPMLQTNMPFAAMPTPINPPTTSPATTITFLPPNRPMTNVNVSYENENVFVADVSSSEMQDLERIKKINYRVRMLPPPLSFEVHNQIWQMNRESDNHKDSVDLADAGNNTNNNKTNVEINNLINNNNNVVNNNNNKDDEEFDDSDEEVYGYGNEPNNNALLQQQQAGYNADTSTNCAININIKVNVDDKSGHAKGTAYENVLQSEYRPQHTEKTTETSAVITTATATDTDNNTKPKPGNNHLSKSHEDTLSVDGSIISEDLYEEDLRLDAYRHIMDRWHRHIRVLESKSEVQERLLRSMPPCPGLEQVRERMKSSKRAKESTNDTAKEKLSNDISCVEWEPSESELLAEWSNVCMEWWHDIVKRRHRRHRHHNKESKQQQKDKEQEESKHDSLKAEAGAVTNNQSAEGVQESNINVAPTENEGVDNSNNVPWYEYNHNSANVNPEMELHKSFSSNENEDLLLEFSQSIHNDTYERDNFFFYNDEYDEEEERKTTNIDNIDNINNNITMAAVNSYVAPDANYNKDTSFYQSEQQHLQMQIQQQGNEINTFVSSSADHSMDYHLPLTHSSQATTNTSQSAVGSREQQDNFANNYSNAIIHNSNNNNSNNNFDKHYTMYTNENNETKNVISNVYMDEDEVSEENDEVADPLVLAISSELLGALENEE